jgi:hypothetical protein
MLIVSFSKFARLKVKPSPESPLVSYESESESDDETPDEALRIEDGFFTRDPKTEDDRDPDEADSDPGLP